MATQPQYGYVGYYKPQKPPTLARAAAGADPYGLAPNNRSGPLGANPLGLGSSSGFGAPAPNAGARPPVQAKTQVAAPPSTQQITQALGAIGGGQQGPPTAAAVNKYDLNTDPALQQIQALVGLSDEQAQAQALKERQNLLLSYGDPNVAAAVLGQNDPTVAAAQGNPTSTVAQLGQQRDRNLHDLTEGLNQNNLAYSGYRVMQEQQAGQDYENALAQAAAGLNSNLDQVSGNLGAALSSSAAQRAQAISEAENRAAQQAGDTGIDPGTIDPNALAAAAAGGGAGDAKGASYTDPVTQALIDAGLTRRQGFLNYGLRNSGML